MRRLLPLFLLLLPSLAEASGAYIPPGQEEKIQALLQPVAFHKPFADGWLLSGISIDRDRVKLEFTGPKDASAEVSLHHPDSGAAGERMGPVLVGGGPPEAVREALQRALQSKGTENLPWVVSTDAPRKKPREPDLGTVVREQTPFDHGYDRVLTAAALLLLAGVLLWLGVRVVRRRLLGRTAALALLGVTLGGLVLRLLVSPRTFLHEYYHAGDHMRGYLFRDTHQSFFYGETGPTIYSFANALVGGDEQAVFTANLVLSVLTIPALAAFDFVLFGRWKRALFTASLFAILPLNLRFAASEDLSNPGVFFGTVALALGVVFIRHGGWLAALGAGLATALTMQARPELMTWPIAVLAVALAASQGREWRRIVSLPALAAAALLVAVCGPRALEMLSLPHERGGMGLWMPSLVAFFDPRAVPPVLLPMAAGGLAWGLARRRWLTVALLAVAAGYAHLTLTFFSNPPPYNLRTQMITLPMLLVLCASVVPLLESLAKERARLARWAPAALLVVTGAWAATSLPWVTQLADAQQEWDFLVRAVPRLPKEEGVLLTVVDGSEVRIAAFPEHLLEREKSRLIPRLLPSPGKADAEWPAADGRSVYYQGMYCYSYFPDDPPADPLTPRCAQVHERYVLEPIVTEEIPGPGYSPMEYAAPPYLLGFYRLVGLRERAAPAAAVP